MLEGTGVVWQADGRQAWCPSGIGEEMYWSGCIWAGIAVRIFDLREVGIWRSGRQLAAGRVSNRHRGSCEIGGG